jgi:hypothetical protein
LVLGSRTYILGSPDKDKERKHNTMSDYSHDQSIADGKREAELGYPTWSPQKPNEPSISFNTRVNTFEWTRKEQDGN